jgi:hypothetical protein
MADMPVQKGEKRRRTYSVAEIAHIHGRLASCADDLKGFLRGLEENGFDGELEVDGRSRGLVDAIDTLRGWTDKLKTAYEGVTLRAGLSPDPGMENESPKRGRKPKTPAK